MAQEQDNTSSGQVRSFDKSLNEDINDFHLPSNEWTQARNAINNSVSGDLGKLGNEPGNIICLDDTKVPYPIIGTIHVIEDKWLIYSTDNTNSEIGIFKEGLCAYVPLINNTCLGFSLDNLIIGVSKSTSNCTYKAYWDDGINPSRTFEFNADFIDAYGTSNYFDPNAYDYKVNGQYTSTIPWLTTNCVDSNGTAAGGCITCDNTSNVDCDKLRLAQFISPICPRVEKGYSGGNLLNGSYFVAMAYAVNGQKISDWYVSNVQGLFAHENPASSLDVFIDSIDPDYDQIIVGVGSVINQQTVIRQAGIYSTRQTRLSFDIISDTWPAIPIEQLPIMSPIVDKSDAMYNVGDYLLRVGPTSKFDFNYQPLANQIRVKWQSVEYPADYYHKGGNNVGYMRDEVYAFFIQWIYDTGDKSASYHIPGRPPFTTDLVSIAPGTPNAILGDNVTWQVFNTAAQTATFSPGTNLTADGGSIIAEGYMGYWESTEFYPDNKPEIWNASFYCWSALDTSIFSPPCPPTGPIVLPTPYSGTVINDYDLCGKNIRHHKFPEDNLISQTHLYSSGGGTIRIMGVDFENIRAPRDNEGNLIPGIVGYRILRSTRNGNKTVIAKGMVNHMRRYNIPNSNKNGLMPNYPYDDLRSDSYLSQSQSSTTASTGAVNFVPMPPGFGGAYGFSDTHYTFHSPETNFNNPFLSAKEFRMYGAMYGTVNGKFDLSEKHPQEKLITNLTFFLASIAGVGIALVAANGTRQTTYKDPTQGYSGSGIGLGTGAGTYFSPATTDALAITAGDLFKNFGDAIKIAADASMFTNTAFLGQSINTGILGYGTAQTLINSGYITGAVTKTKESVQSNGYLDDLGGVGFGLNVVALPMFLQYFSDGTDSIIRLVKAMISYRDFALRYHSHGFYDQFAPRTGNPTFRAEIIDQQYLNPEIADKSSYKINNLFRQRTVHFETATSFLQNPTSLGTPTDNSRVIPSGATYIEDVINNEYISNCSSFYGALKVRIRNQYSQIGTIVQLPTSSCYTAVTFDTTNGTSFPNGNIVPNKGDFTVTQFGGDVYINRYTEKNTFFYFYDWLEGQPDGAQLNYNQKIMVPYPTYWANFNGFQTSDFTSQFFSGITSFSMPTGSPQEPFVPSDYYALDGPTYSMAIGSFNPANLKFDKRGWFYLFNSGVRDFFVESEINVAYRDYNENESQRFYDPYQGTDTKELFKTSIIKSGNFYKYDISLSVTKLFTNYTSWASTQSIAYNPYIAETCFVYQPTRIIYSLPSQYEGIKDGWKVFLTNNYYDFDNYVTCVKPINKSGAIIFFDSASPVQFQGTDQLETGLGTKLTIGDGGLFSQPLQALINVEASHEYGSCQNRLSVINTPAGIYWMSQNQGKIFTVAGQGLKEISNINMKWWFAQYLPYQIVKDFPDFQLLDNPVSGVGCQSMYDNENGLLYFCKKDYKLIDEFKNIIKYSGSSNVFIVTDENGEELLQFNLGDPNSDVWPLYFEDASWTISFDPKTDGWISYHDWHPSLNMPGKNTFMTVSPDDLRTVWIHNERCDLYCNYYGVDYPFEVEFTVNTGQDINSLRSIQYYLECYKYAPNCYDRFHVLDYNFDEATIYNTEQTSGLLKLVLNPKQDPTAILQYPIINPTNINVLFSKEENKYRFNQFWDITEDRGEYYNSLIPGFAERVIWNTQTNGYIRALNNNNMNYNKPPLQRKKFRHYKVSVLLRKLISGNKKMMVMLADVKNLLSPR